MAIFDFITDLIHDVLGGTQSSDLADLGADPDQLLSETSTGVADTGGAGDAFPAMGGSSVMAAVNRAMETATENYREGMEVAEHAPRFPTAGEQAQQFIDNVMTASPEQLEHLSGQLGALNAGDEIRNSVGESMQGLADRDAAHSAAIDADRELTHAKFVSAAADRAIDQAGNAL